MSEFNSVFDAEPSFWIFMGVLGAITLAYILVCWLMPPKKQVDVFVIDNETEEVA